VPQHQGQLDGLCGVYAISNAMEQCGVSEPELAFRVACLATANKRWPDLLWEGTTFGDLKRMIRLVLDSPVNDIELKVRYPFAREVPVRNRSYWDAFDKAFEDTDAVCGIIGINQPSAHWVVVSRHRERLLFTDSAAGQPYELRDRDKLYAGARQRNADDWLVAKRELALFYH
jgi:hypothetical protein